MPIRFRCPNCERLLGIARRKAGAQIHCPQCGAGVIVPSEDAPPAADLRDIDDLLGPPAANGTAPHVPEPPALAPDLFAPADPFAPTYRAPAAAPPAARPAKRHAVSDVPLFEQSDVDELLGLNRREGLLELSDENDTKPVSGMDALSLEEGMPGKVVLSSQKATILVIAAALLMVAAFVAGYFVGSPG